MARYFAFQPRQFKSERSVDVSLNSDLIITKVSPHQSASSLKSINLKHLRPNMQGFSKVKRHANAGLIDTVAQQVQSQMVTSQH